MHAPSPDGGAEIPTPPPIALPPPVEPSEAPRRHWRDVFQATSSCLLSAAAHAAVLLTLALTALSAPPPPTGGMLFASATDPAGQKLETISFETEPVELEQVAALPSKMPAPGAMRLGEVAAAETVSAIGVGDLADGPVGEIGALFGADGRGMAPSGSGRGGATFFGVRARGRRFVYLVDNSSSMDEGRFETAVAELLRSVRMLDENQLFYVIFYSDMAYPLFYPDASPRLVPGTRANKEKLADWLPAVELCGRTRGEEAMALALSLAPDAIYLLGDGAFDDRTIQRTLAIRAPRPTIHALGFDMKKRAALSFKLLAKQFSGAFTHVHVRPEMKRLAHQRDRPRNHAPHGVWGLRLR